MPTDRGAGEDKNAEVERALSLLVNAARVSPPLREAVAVVEREIRRLRQAEAPR